MASSKPSTIAELFKFYHEDIKPLYSQWQAMPRPPIECALEFHAALDHLSRQYSYGDPEHVVVDRAAGHLKRSCFDGFKLLLYHTNRQYEQLLDIDTSIIDNGKFDLKMHRLMAEIRKEATAARASEGSKHDPQQWHVGYDNWLPVYAKCMLFQERFLLDKHVPWAKRKQVGYSRKTFMSAICASLIAGIILGKIAPVVWRGLAWLTKAIADLFAGSSPPPLTPS